MPNLKQAFYALGIVGLSTTAANADVTGVIIQGKAPNADITQLNMDFKDAQTCLNFGDTLNGNYILSCFDEDGEIEAQRVCTPVRHNPRSSECTSIILGNE